MTFTGLLIHTCYIGSKTTVTNDYGESVATWTYSTDATKCRMIPVSASEVIQEPGRFDDVRYRMGFEYDTTITVDNRIKYGTKYYRVKEMYPDSSSHHKTALLVELE